MNCHRKCSTCGINAKLKRLFVLCKYGSVQINPLFAALREVARSHLAILSLIVYWRLRVYCRAAFEFLLVGPQETGSSDHFRTDPSPAMHLNRVRPVLACLRESALCVSSPVNARAHVCNFAFVCICVPWKHLLSFIRESVFFYER